MFLNASLSISRLYLVNYLQNVAYWWCNQLDKLPLLFFRENKVLTPPAEEWTNKTFKRYLPFQEEVVWEFAKDKAI